MESGRTSSVGNDILGFSAGGEVVNKPDHGHLDWIKICEQAAKVSFSQLLSCQPRVTVASCFVYKVIMDLELIDQLCINPIHRIGLIHK